MPAAGSKRISQETFNDVVKENMEDFDMELEEAIEDAKKQFMSQGVDLSALIVRPELLNFSSKHPTLQLVEGLKTSKQLCDDLKQMQEAIRNDTDLQSMLGGNGLIDILIEFLETNSETPDTLRTLVLTCQNHRQNKDFIRDTGIQRLVDCVLNCGNDSELKRLALATIKSVCAQHEENKQRFIKRQGLTIVVEEFERQTVKGNDVMLKVLASMFRILTIHDDREVEFSMALENIKRLVDEGIIDKLIGFIKTRKDELDVVTPWILVLKQIAITEDNCQLIVQTNGVTMVQELMTSYPKESALIKNGISMMRNIVAVDSLKRGFVDSRGLATVCQAMEEHPTDRSIQEHCCATIAALALRQTDLCREIVDSGVLRLVAKAMHLHHDSETFLRQASLAVRNLVARNPELREYVLSENVEDILRQAQGRRGCGDEAYSALRDLGCDIQLYERKGKANFNPTIKQSRELETSIRSKAAAPFASR